MKFKVCLLIIATFWASMQLNAQGNSAYSMNSDMVLQSPAPFAVSSSDLKHITPFDIKVVREGQGLSNDSSYYDLLRIDSSSFLIAGKFGIFQKININGEIESIQNPIVGKDIFRLIRLNKELVLACADDGQILFYNIRSGACKTLKIDGLDGYCIYNACITADNTILICGGKSQIAHCKKVVPHGFIMASSDGGNTWVKKYHATLSMVWSMVYDSNTKMVKALVYRPNRSVLISAPMANLHFKKEQTIGTGIYHELQINEHGDWIATGGNLKYNGRIKFQHQPIINLNTGMVWSRSRNKNRELYTSCRGQLVCLSEGLTHIINTPLSRPFNFYECGFFDGNHAIAVGSAQTIVLVTFKD